jgi:tRNA(adenine34) deaminase
MCAGALVLARIKKLVFGAKDPKTGAFGSAYNILAAKNVNHRFKIATGVLEQDCSSIISEFFKTKRKRIR